MTTRILHIVPNMHMGGLETFIMNVYRNIDRSKFQFDFLEHYKEESFYDQEITLLGGKIYRFSLRNDNNIFRYIKNLNKFFKEHQEYKIIHCHMESIGALIFFIAKLHGIKVRIGHAHTNSTNYDLKGFIKRIISKPFKYTTTINLACSDEAGRYLFKHKPFMVVSNAINTSSFQYDEQVRMKLRKEFNLENKLIIGHVGRMDKGKNQLFLLEVFAKYIKNNLDARLVMVGDGEDYLKITNKIKELRLEDYVLLLGVRQDINQLYSMFDVFVFPSLYEGLGIVLIEAQVNGLTCLTSDTVPRTTKISNGIKYLSLNDIELWVKELKNIKSNSHQLKYNKLFNDYDIKKIVTKLTKIYRIEEN